LWQRQSQVALHDNARAYLFTTAINAMFDSHRRDRSRSRGKHVELSETEDILRGREEEDDHYWRESLRRVEDELKNLKPSTRRVFLMYHVEHLTFAETAERLGISTRTVEREMVRAVDHLKSALGSIFENASGD
jgi:RNA polymerase sigma-70 factor (ECF subfamily)